MIFIQPSIDPVLISIGFLDIRWYSLAYIFGFLFGSLLIKKLNQSFGNLINNKTIDRFFIWSILGVIIGGRIGYVIFYQTSSLLIDPFFLFEIWKGGMSFHGGLIGIIISTYLFTKYNNLNFYYLSDLISIVAPIGIFFGRIANFINSELYGKITNFPIAMIYPKIDLNTRHPSQLYEAFFEGFLLFIVMLIIYSKNKGENTYGKISGYFLIFYSIFRFLNEFLREPDAHLGLFLNIFSMGQILSIPLLILGIIIINKNEHKT
tara:strand:- start:349 stop:1137 length:789 start_codon:yes stop_codon:yes gene_type:complete